MDSAQIEQLRAAAAAGKPDAQFLMAQLCRQSGDFAGMLHWLREAGHGGMADAEGELGRCFETGQGVDADIPAAMQHYDKAIEAGSAFASFYKAQLLYKSRRGAESGETIRDHLVHAAMAGVVPALRTTGYLLLQQDAERGHAVQCLRQAAEKADPVSNFMLGWLLRDGDEHDVAEAAFRLQAAAAAQYPFAADVLGSLQGVAPAARPATHGLDPRWPFPLEPDRGTARRRDMNADPPIVLFSNVLDIVDRAYLMYLSRPLLVRAHVIDPDSEGKGKVSDVRTSESTYLPFAAVDIIARYIESKIVRETGEALSHSEPMSILRYAPGEYYRPHLDYFKPDLEAAQELLRDGGQRTASAVTYLAAPTAGGGTSFPKLGLTIPPEAGSTLWFRNCNAEGEVDERSLHAGDTVEAGEKWVVTKWFRQNPTHYLQY